MFEYSDEYSRIHCAKYSNTYLSLSLSLHYTLLEFEYVLLIALIYRLISSSIQIKKPKSRTPKQSY